MTEINDGGPAFPIKVDLPDGNNAIHPGLSRRDWFAGQVLSGMLDFSDARSYQITDAAALEVATSAYKIADAMLAARAKPAPADPRDALIAELVAKLGEAREAIAAVDEEVLANIDAALAKAKAEIAP